jgi:hypothetical protein
MKTLLDWWTQARDEGLPPPCLLIDCAGLEGGQAALPREACSALECLFSGDLGEELADVGGYLAQLGGWEPPVFEVVDDLMRRQLAVLLVMPSAGDDDAASGAGSASSAASATSFTHLHRHLRKFNVVYGPNGQPLFWRYYDPRVLPGVLASFDDTRRQAFLGPFAAALVMLEDGTLQVAASRSDAMVG